MKGLEETQKQVHTVAPGIHVHLLQTDLSDLTSLEAIFKQACHLSEGQDHEQAILIHNAASLGDLTKPMSQQTDPQVLQDYFAANFTSMYTLTALFLSKFTSSVSHTYVVNVTSLLASNFNYGFGFYSSGKAARNALMGVLAVEYPSVRCLSYSPGVVDTDMMVTVGSESYAESVRVGVQGLHERKVMITASQAASRLVEVLAEDTFDNGTLVDYHDKK